MKSCFAQCRKLETFLAILQSKMILAPNIDFFLGQLQELNTKETNKLEILEKM